jgi:hypothetical protein
MKKLENSSITLLNYLHTTQQLCINSRSTYYPIIVTINNNLYPSCPSQRLGHRNNDCCPIVHPSASSRYAEEEWGLQPSALRSTVHSTNEIPSFFIGGLFHIEAQGW